MTAAEMHHSFNLKHSNTLESYQVQKLLNEAQNVFTGLYRPTVDTDEVSRKKLQHLISTDTITPAANVSDNISSDAVFATLPADFREILYENVIISSTVIKVKPIKYDEYNINIDNPFKQPDATLAWRLDYGSAKHELIPLSGATITTYYIRYLKNFTDIDIDANNTCGFDAKDHEEIVNIAISLLVINIEK